MSAWRKPAAWAAIVIVAAAWFIAWRAPAAGTYHDDGVYMVTAKSLAEGKGYRILSLPNEIPQTKYPPLFPLLLAAVWKVAPSFPANVPVLKLVPLLAAFFCLWFTWRLLREEGAPSHVATAILILAAASAWTIYFATALLSESLFAALTTGALLSLRRYERGGRLSHLCLAAILAALAFETRTLGIALLASGTVLLLWRRNWRHAAVFCLIAAALCAPWIVWVLMHSSPATPTDAYYSSGNYQGWNVLLNFTVSEKIHIVAANALMSLLTPAMVAGFPMKGLFLLPALLIGLLIWLGVARGGLNALTLFLAFYTALVLCWAWAPIRFLAPLAAILYFYGWRLIAAHRRFSLVCSACLMLASASALVEASRRTLRLGDSLPTLQESDSWYRLAGLLEWARHHTPPDAILAGNLDPLCYLYTGRKAVRSFAAEPYSLIYRQSGTPIGTSAAIAAHLDRLQVSYWMIHPNSSFLEGPHLIELQKELLRRNPDAMRRVDVGLGESHGVVEIRAPVRVHLGRKD